MLKEGVFALNKEKWYNGTCFKIFNKGCFMMSAVTSFAILIQRSDQELKIEDTNTAQLREQQTERGNETIPDDVFARALQKVQKYVGGVQPSSTLIETTPPKITIEMLQRLQKKGSKA